MKENPDQELELCEFLLTLTSFQERLQTCKDRSVVMIMGSTGNGKSTLLNYLLNAELEKFIDDMRIERIGVKPGKKEYSKIGHRLAKAETAFGQIHEAPGCPFVYCDCPGFFDTRGLKARIIAGVCNQAVIQQAAKIQSILLVLDHSNFREERAAGLINQLSILRTMLPNLSQVMKSVFIVVTKAKKGITHLDMIALVTAIRDEYEDLLTQMPDNIGHQQSKEILDLILSHPECVIVADPLDDQQAPNGMLFRMFAPIKGVFVSDAPNIGPSREEIKRKISEAEGIERSLFKFVEHDETLRGILDTINPIVNEGRRHLNIINSYETRKSALGTERAQLEVAIQGTIQDYQVRITKTFQDEQLNIYLTQTQNLITSESKSIVELEAECLKNRQALDQMSKEKDTLQKSEAELKSKLNIKIPHSFSFNQGLICKPYKPINLFEAQIAQLSSAIARLNDLLRSNSHEIEVKRQRVHQLRAEMQNTRCISEETRQGLRNELEGLLAREQSNHVSRREMIDHSIHDLDIEYADAVMYFQKMQDTRVLDHLINLVTGMPTVFDSQSEIGLFVQQYIRSRSDIDLVLNHRSQIFCN